MEPWIEEMCSGLRQTIKDLKAENAALKQEIAHFASVNRELVEALNRGDEDDRT